MKLPWSELTKKKGIDKYLGEFEGEVNQNKYRMNQLGSSI